MSQDAQEATDANGRRRGGGPLRTVRRVARATEPPDELIRFVRGPDGQIVPDLARRLPGRGVWVDATRESVAAAVQAQGASPGA